jgi:hypothetical protein
MSWRYNPFTGRLDYYQSGGGGSGAFGSQVISGDMDGSNVSFTVSTAISGTSFIALNGQLMVQDVDYTISGTDITYVSPPASDLMGVTHVLYAGTTSISPSAYLLGEDGLSVILETGEPLLME